jgi:hapalindole-type alkaloid chlorinase
MSVSQQENIAAAERPLAAATFEDLFASWGFERGTVVSGWTCSVLANPDQHGTARIGFARGDDAFDARFRLAGDEPYLVQMGRVAVSHGAVSDEISTEAVDVVIVLAEWLNRHGRGADIARSLDAAAAQPADRRRAPSEDTVVASTPPEAAASDAASEAQPYVVVHDAPPLDPAKRAPADRPVLDFQFIDYADLVKFPDALREIYRGERGGLVIRGVYSKDDMARVVERLEVGQTDFPMMNLPASQRSYFLGLCLEGGDPTLKAYLEAAGRFREQARRVYEDLIPFEERMETVFGAMAGGRKVELAHFHDGRAFTPATIRILPVGGQLAPHCGNEMYNRPSYEYLNTFVDKTDQISFFLTLQEAEEGGGLIIYSLKWAEVGPDHILPDNRSNVGSLLGESEWTEVRPEAGDVLIFDGGRWLHRVDWVRGKRTRWTMGGFLQFDRPGERLLYFA